MRHSENPALTRGRISYVAEGFFSVVAFGLIGERDSIRQLGACTLTNCSQR